MHPCCAVVGAAVLRGRWDWVLEHSSLGFPEVSAGGANAGRWCWLLAALSCWAGFPDPLAVLSPNVGKLFLPLGRKPQGHFRGALYSGSKGIGFWCKYYWLVSFWPGRLITDLGADVVCMSRTRRRKLSRTVTPARKIPLKTVATGQQVLTGPIGRTPRPHPPAASCLGG